MNKYKVYLTVKFSADVQEENEEKAVELLANNIRCEHVSVTGIRDAGIYKLNNVAMQGVDKRVEKL